MYLRAIAMIWYALYELPFVSFFDISPLYEGNCIKCPISHDGIDLKEDLLKSSSMPWWVLQPGTCVSAIKYLNRVTTTPTKYIFSIKCIVGQEEESSRAGANTPRAGLSNRQC